MLVDLLELLNEDLCVAKRVLNGFAVRPMYSLWPSVELIKLLYTTSLVRHLPSRGQSLATLQLQPCSTGRCLEPSILLLWLEIVLFRFGQVL